MCKKETLRNKTNVIAAHWICDCDHCVELEQRAIRAEKKNLYLANMCKDLDYVCRALSPLPPIQTIDDYDAWAEEQVDKEGSK